MNTSTRPSSFPSWHEDMQSDLIVAGLAERTQEAYLRAVRPLSEYYNGTRPADLSETHVKDYLLWLRSEKRAAPGTLRIAIGGLRFYYRQTFPTDWNGGAGIRADTRIVLKTSEWSTSPVPAVDPGTLKNADNSAAEIVFAC